MTFRTHLPKGNPTIEVYNDVPGPSNIPRAGRHGETPFVSLKDGRIPWQMKLTDEQGRARYPFLIIDSISWRGPLVSDEEQSRRAEYFPREEGNIDQVREGLRRLVRRAFRRPITDEELDGYVSIVKAELAAKEKFPDAVKAGMLAVFSSKIFLFIAEGDEDVNRSALNDWEIASRLSFLLWSTMPDEELSSLAEQGKLRNKAELSRQVARMLADERAGRFTDSFATQWLRLRKVGMFPPDKKLYPEYDKTIEANMVGETKSFFPRSAPGRVDAARVLKVRLEHDERIAREVLWTPGRGSAAGRVSARGAAGGQQTRRPPDAGSDPLAHVGRDAASARASRRVALGGHLWQDASLAAAERRAHRHQPRGCVQGHAPNENRSAHPRRLLRRLPRENRSARTRL